MTVTAARHAVSAAALARDRVALVALGASLPATTAFAYERHRARAYAHALEDSGDAALGELAVGAGCDASLGGRAGSGRGRAPSSARRPGPLDRVDRARSANRPSVRRLRPCRPARLDARSAGEWRRAARAAALVRHPRAALVALGAAFNAMGDRRAYRVALAATGLLTALVALLALPTLLVDGGTSVAGVTAPSFAAPPSVVVVPNRPRPPQQPPRESPSRPGPAVRREHGDARERAPARNRLRLRPSRRAARARSAPGRPAPAPAAPPPTPSPRPLPHRLRSRARSPLRSPSRRPCPSRSPRRRRLPPPRPPAPPPKANKGKGKAKGHEKQAAKAAARSRRCAASRPRRPHPRPASRRRCRRRATEPPGQAKDDSTASPTRTRRTRTSRPMYVGLGTLLAIGLIVLLVYLLA